MNETEASKKKISGTKVLALLLQCRPFVPIQFARAVIVVSPTVVRNAELPFLCIFFP